MEFEYPFGNWAVPGNTGQPVPGDGEPGKSHTFSFGSAEQTQGTQTTQEDTQGGSPITVTMVTEKAEKESKKESKKESVLAWVLTMLAGVVILLCHVIAGYLYVQYFKERKKYKGGESA